MPELPEVETIRRILDSQLKGQKIHAVRVNHPQVIAYPDADRFCEELTGQTFCGTGRRGKFMCLYLKNGLKIVLHLRMTGCLLVVPPEYPRENHTHLVMILENGNELRFSDIRRFGRFWLLQKDEEDVYSGIHKLGLEPTDENLTAEYLQRHFGKSRKAIKTCLLEQNVICGIGNIYSDEILFAARLHPQRQAVTLSEEEWTILAETIRHQIVYFTEMNEMTPEEFLAGKGKEYRNTPYFQVYGHGGKPCPVCGGMLEKSVIGGRSSVWCRNCQKEE